MSAALAILISLATLVSLVVHCVRDKREMSAVRKKELARLANHAQQLEMRVAILERK